MASGSVGFVDRDEVYLIVLRSVEFAGQTDLVAELYNGGLPAAGSFGRREQDKVSMLERRYHAVAVNSEREGVDTRSAQRGHMKELRD